MISEISIGLGIGMSFVAMLCWGFGDFLIQKSTRKLGDWETLFVICGFGSLVLLPFVWKDIPALFTGGEGGTGLLILSLCSITLIIAALLDFEALKKGKLAVVEPIWSFEIISSAILAYFVLHERISIFQTLIIIALIGGLIAVSLKEKVSIKKFFIEKGVILAFIAAIIMGSANFLYGWGSRISNPLMVNFFVNIVTTIVTGLYLIYNKKFIKTFRDISINKGTLLTMSILDNSAWVAFAFSMSLIPIAVATALSESYIIVAVILGISVNHEKLQIHQKIGLIFALISTIILAAITI